MLSRDVREQALEVGWEREGEKPHRGGSSSSIGR